MDATTRFLTFFRFQYTYYQLWRLNFINNQFVCDEFAKKLTQTNESLQNELRDLQEESKETLESQIEAVNQKFIEHEYKMQEQIEVSADQLNKA